MSYSHDNIEMLREQEELEREFESIQTVRPFKINPNSNTLVIPSEYRQNFNSFRKDNLNDCLLLVFRCLSSFSQVLYSTKKHGQTVKQTFANCAPRFITWLLEFAHDDFSSASLLKDYETYRVNFDGTTPQGSGLFAIRSFITHGMKIKEFSYSLPIKEKMYLKVLSETKGSPFAQKKQFTLTKWFSYSGWLRLDDPGIGNQLFDGFSSPKLLTTSFSVIVGTTLREIQRQKSELIHFFKQHNIRPNAFEMPDLSGLTPNDVTRTTSKARCGVINMLVKHAGKTLPNAIKTIIWNHARPQSRGKVFKHIEENSEIENCALLLGNNESKQPFFTSQILALLSEYAHSSEPELAMPITEAENILFSWLMAWQMVQPEDITKLKFSQFSFLQRQTGDATHIQCTYNKGRAKIEHIPPMLEVNTVQGGAVYQYINDRVSHSQDAKKIPLAHKIPKNECGPNTVIGRILTLMNAPHMQPLIEKELDINDASPIFLRAVSKMLAYGESPRSTSVKIKYKNKKGEGWSREQCEKDFYRNAQTPIAAYFFTLTHIKNSSVHSNTDKFAPTQLVNYNSHSMTTERDSYLTPDNEDWKNACGLVTRAVMQDLIINCLRPSNKEIFESEFVSANEIISIRSMDVLAKMKVITGKRHGSIQGTGFIDSIDNLDHTPGTIYVIDSPVTVVKYKHYIVEAMSKYKNLAQQAPEFLLFTVCPTCEWIEVLFDTGKFSKTSIEKGEEMYSKLKKHLTPLFTEKLRG
jgi:hypothetical protein